MAGARPAVSGRPVLGISVESRLAAVTVEPFRVVLAALEAEGSRGSATRARPGGKFPRRLLSTENVLLGTAARLGRAKQCKTLLALPRGGGYPLLLLPACGLPTWHSPVSTSHSVACLLQLHGSQVPR